MYTILVGEDNQLVTSVRERIMQRSKLVDSLHFLVEANYKGYDMSNFTVVLEYLLPVSHEYKTEILTKSDELYKGSYLEYKLPFDTNLTKEAGKVEMQLTFTNLTMDADGRNTQLVRKTGKTSVTILPISAWSDIIPDGALTALDQRIIETQAMINQIDAVHQYLDETKADNMVFDKETRTIQLTSNGKPIGSKIVISCSTDGIVGMRIDENGNLVAVYSDGSETIVGKVGSECAGIYVPSLQGDELTFTLSDKATDKVISIDIDKTNEWNELNGAEQASTYIWREL